MDGVEWMVGLVVATGRRYVCCTYGPSNQADDPHSIHTPHTYLGDAEVVVLALLADAALCLGLDPGQLRLLPQLRLVLQRLALDGLLLRQVLLLLAQLLLLAVLLRVQLIDVALPLQLVSVLRAPPLVLRLRVQRPARLLPFLFIVVWFGVWHRGE